MSISISSIYSYTPYEFKSKLQSVHDKEQTTLYQVLRTFREGTQLKKTPELDITISKFNDNEIEKWYRYLRQESGFEGPPKKISLPYNAKKRARALVENIGRQYSGALDIEAGMKTHRILHDMVIDNAHEVQYPFSFEIVAIPYKKELLEENPRGYISEFIGYINYSYSPKGTRFEGNYGCWKTEGKDNEFRAVARDINGVLDNYGFSFIDFKNTQKTKIPCVILGNLISPKILPKGQSKTEIDTTPFTDTILKAVARIAKDIPTFKAAGIRTPDYHSSSYYSYQSTTTIRAYERITAFDVVEEYLLPRMRGPSCT